MKLRLKLILVFTVLIALLLSAVFYWGNSFFKDYIKTSVSANFRDFAELSETAYFAFTESLKIRVLDWSSDGVIRMATERILEFQAKGAEKEKQQAVRELSAYLRERKMIFDPNVIMVDILDKNGIIIVSSREDRLGLDEKKEEEMWGAHRFSETIKAGFNEAFVASVVFEEDEWPEPMIHVTTRIFSVLQTPDKKPAALDAVMLVHFANTKQLSDVLTGKWQESIGAKTGLALFQHYKSAEIYLVNRGELMITDPQADKNGISRVFKQKVATLPVKACFEEEREISEEYANYEGENVFGASMCLKRDNLVLIAEASAKDVLRPIGQFQRQLILIGFAAFLTGILATMFLTRWFLKNIYKLAAAVRQITIGNLKARTKIKSRDEIGELAQFFNEAFENIEKSQNSLKQKEKELTKINEELALRVEQLEKFKQLTVGRELKMVELKEQIEQLMKEKIFND